MSKEENTSRCFSSYIYCFGVLNGYNNILMKNENLRIRYHIRKYYIEHCYIEYCLS